MDDMPVTVDPTKIKSLELRTGVLYLEIRKNHLIGARKQDLRGKPISYYSGWKFLPDSRPLGIVRTWRKSSTRAIQLIIDPTASLADFLS